MTQQSIQDQIDQDKHRQSCIDAQVAVTPEHQMKRLKAIKAQAELALARVYGHRLDERVSARIINGLALSPEVLCSIGGGVDEMPNNLRGWDAFVVAMAEQEPLAKLSIDHSDAQLKETIRQQAMNDLRPEQRLQMTRAGTLDAHLEKIVKFELEKRAGV